MHRILSLLSLLTCLFQTVQGSTSNTLSICALFQNEAPYLKEWIEYHKLVGVDHFYLYNDQSCDDFLPLLKPYIESNTVTLIQYEAQRCPSIYEDALKISQDSSQWLIKIDLNDFIVPIKADTITQILKTKEEDFSTLQIGVNLYQKAQESSSLQIETLSKKSTSSHLQRSLHQISSKSVHDTLALDPQEIVINRYDNLASELGTDSDHSILRFAPALREKMNLSKNRRIEMVTNFDIRDFFIFPKKLKSQNIDLQENMTIPSITKVFFEPSQAEKVILFNISFEPQVLSRIPKEKLVYFLWEPWEFPLPFYESFGKVYTWNDDLVDNKKFFKIHYPSLLPMEAELPSFEDKKLCIMVAGTDVIPKNKPNDLYCERVDMVDFFETKPQGEFAVYGKNWNLRSYRDYKGSIPGFHSGPEKTAIMKQYRFSICFENTKNISGYVTEKIFCCFAAGCVPIYWGAKNIETYIPKNCFIDYRDFSSKEDLYKFIKDMPKDTYNQYLENIRTFLQSDQAKVFSPAYFQKLFYQAMTESS